MESVLEARFHHIVERLHRTWGNPQAFNDMFSDLIFDTRTDRTGWPADAWDELQFLQQLHKNAYEQKPAAQEVVRDEIKWVS